MQNMKILQVLRVGILVQFLLFTVACGGGSNFKSAWLATVYQNPLQSYLDTLNLSEPPTQRLFFVIETNWLDSLQQSTFRLHCPVQPQPVELGLFPHKDFYDNLKEGPSINRYLVGTRKLEDRTLVERVVTHLKSSYIVRKSNIGSDTIFYSGGQTEWTNDASIEYLTELFSRKIEVKK